MNKLFFTLLSLFLMFNLYSQGAPEKQENKEDYRVDRDLVTDPDLAYYLPPTDYDATIPTPESFLGYQIGKWHVSHDLLIGYVKLLAEKSDRVQLTKYAETYEERPLYYLTITSAENFKNLDKIKSEHAKLTDYKSSDQVDIKNLPGIVYQGYSIHGNESSGANASLLMAYWLAAGQSDLVDKTLNELVILIDPCMNPDGFNRFANWVNAHKHHTLVSDPNDREYHEHWPKGRTNHYLFDLNRDWLLLTHPESRGRVHTFHEWNPIVLTDHHEMGTNSTFFFQPGVPSRTNPLTEQKNQDLTEEISYYHMEALDELECQYFTKERFDDFYYGKGSTYPDVQGCVGILFEQASSRGHFQESKNGILSFPFTIRNQVATSLSTQKAAFTMREKLLNNKRDFYKNSAKAAASHSVKAYNLKSDDPFKIARLTEILNRHKIKVYKPQKLIDIAGTNPTKDSNVKSKKEKYEVVIPLQQKQHKLIRSLFENVTDFQDSVFYDVSTWVFNHAFNLNIDSIMDETVLKKTILTEWDCVSYDCYDNNKYDQPKGTFAYKWTQYNAPAFTNELLKNDFKLRRLIIDNEAFIYCDEIPETKLINEAAERWNISIINPEIANASFPSKDKYLTLPSVAIIAGKNVNSYDAGHHWHQLDYRWGMQVSMIDKMDLANISLNRYNTILMPHGVYSDLNENSDKILEWVENGGTLIMLRSAITHGINESWFSLTENNQASADDSDDPNPPGSVLGGAIYETIINQEHPLCYGYEGQEALAVFKKGTQFYKSPQNDKAIALKYSKTPRLSGYSNANHVANAKEGVSAMVFEKGKGKIIALVDSPNFRGFWYGGATLFGNTIFLSNQIDKDKMQR